MINEDDDLLQEVDEIFLEPPEPTVDTDQDSADEDEGGMLYNLSGNINLLLFIIILFHISHISGRQLRAPAEIKLLNNDRVGGTSVNDEPENVGKIYIT